MAKKPQRTLSAILNKGVSTKKSSDFDIFDLSPYTRPAVDMVVEEVLVPEVSEKLIESVIEPLESIVEHVHSLPTEEPVQVIKEPKNEEDEALRIRKEIQEKQKQLNSIKRAKSTNLKALMEDTLAGLKNPASYVAIPRIIADSLLKMRMPPNARILLDFMVRVTLGYNILDISIGQGTVVKKTSIGSKGAVGKAMAQLIDLGIVEMIKEENSRTREAAIYRIEHLREFIEDKSLKKAVKEVVKDETEVSETLYKYLYTKNLRHTDHDRAMDLCRKQSKAYSDTDIIACIDYVYKHGMVGGDREGHKPDNVFLYLDKGFYYVWQRVKQNSARTPASIPADKPNPEDDYFLGLRTRFDEEYGSIKEEKIKELIAKYDLLKPQSGNIEVPYFVAETMAVKKWAEEIGL